MSQFTLSIARGQTKKDVVTAATSGVATDSIVIAFDTTKLTKEEAIRQMEELDRAIIEGKWPPL